MTLDSIDGFKVQELRLELTDDEISAHRSRIKIGCTYWMYGDQWKLESETRIGCTTLSGSDLKIEHVNILSLRPDTDE